MHWVNGYGEAAQFSLNNAPAGSKILFHGNRDGSFIFNIRVVGGVESPTIVRSDKLFLKLKIERERGVKDLGILENDMLKILHDQNISLVVAEKDFWNDLPSMKRFQDLINNELLFTKINHISTKANFQPTDKELFIYRLIK